MIKQLSQHTAEELCAQQVITSLPDCIKQLIDNSIDAKATYIKVMLQEYGKVKIQVIDNGTGIDNFDFLGKKGTTSKNKLNQRFDYLGFRGEAVHSIGRVSGDMEIESKCVRDGHRRKFNVVTSAYEETKQERLCHGQFNFQIPNTEGSRNTGTKVTIQNIFLRLPVRQIELSCKCKQYLKKTNQLIKEYCLIYPQIQFIFINTRQGKEQLLIETTAQKRFDKTSWLQRIKQLDDRIGQNLVYIQSKQFQGFVLDKIQSGSSKQNNFIKKNYHYMFLNRRPIDSIPTILSALNEMYKKYNKNTKYAFVIDLKLEHTEIDVNLTPNKREVFIRKNTLQRIVESLKKQIVSKVVEEITVLNSSQDAKNSTAQKKQPSILTQMSKVNPLNPRKTVFFPTMKEENGKTTNTEKQTNKDQLQSQMKSSINKPEENINQQPQKVSRMTIDMGQLPKIHIDRNKLKEQLNSKLSVGFTGIRKSTNGNPFSLSHTQVKPSTFQQQPSIQQLKMSKQDKVRQQQQDARRRQQFMLQMKEVKIEQNEQQLNRLKMSTASSKSRNHRETSNLIEQEISKQREQEQQLESQHMAQGEGKEHERGRSSWIATMPRGGHDVELENRIKSKLNVDMSKIFTKFNQTKQPNNQSSSLQSPNQNIQQNIHHQEDQVRQIKSETVPKEDEEQINEHLCSQLGELAPKSVKKHHFQHFELIGQFNRGFIITAFNRHFYMVDQHAADEKYHYQKHLQKATKLQQVNCFDQREITPIECDEIQDAKILLKEAGFFYKIENRQQLKLLTCPRFKDQKLGMEYFNLIVSEKKQLTRIDKFTAMCAMSACREATKVGQPLTQAQMKREVINLSGLASPWNCPHGRPTLIDLGAVEKIKRSIKVQKQYMI